MAQTTLLSRLFGRSRRREYWLSIVVLMVLYLAIVGGWLADRLGVNQLYIVMLSPGLVLAWIYARRLHDLNISGFWGLAPLGVNLVLNRGWPAFASAAHLSATVSSALDMVGRIGVIAFVLILGLVPGAKGPNRFGPAHGQAALDASVFD